MNEFILALFYQKDKLKRKTLYLILTGKKTTSTLFYAKVHGLLSVFGLFPRLSETFYNDSINQLIAQKFIRLEEGELYKVKNIDAIYVKYEKILSQLDGWRFSRNDSQLWRLFQCLVQNLSVWPDELKQIPLEVSPFYTVWLDDVLSKMTAKTKEQFIQDCYAIFDALPEKVSLFLIQSLSGADYQGQAFFQLCPSDYQNYPWNECYYLSRIHQFWYQVLHHPDNLVYQIFYTQLQLNYNQSMLQTRHLFLQGYTIEQIAKMRRLKLSTLNDHLIEWALVDSKFPFEKFDLMADATILTQSFQDFKNNYPEKDFICYRLSQIYQLSLTESQLT